MKQYQNKPSLIPIEGVVQHYDWGKPASSSLVALLSGKTFSDDTPCAEIWYGTHKCGPAKVKGNEISLTEIINADIPYMLGERAQSELPFLLKVLSIAKPLSIQLHPSRENAEKLHQEDPVHYPDRNHKPEMAVALTRVSLLYGFRSSKEILSFIVSEPELLKCLSHSSAFNSGENLDEENLRSEVLSRLFSCPAKIISGASRELFKRYSEKEKLSELEEYVLSLSKYFPDGDVGILTFFLFNLISLSPADAIFIGPHIPHAYLSGELVECMANSDNVIRAGLTSKFKDVQTLLRLTDYNESAPCIITGVKTDSGCSFPASAREFQLNFIDTEKGFLKPSATPRILLLVRGEGTISGEKVSAGASFFIPAGSEQSIPFTLVNALLVCAEVPGGSR